MSPLGYAMPSCPLVMRPPKKAEKIAARVERLRKQIAEQSAALEQANNDLKILHLSERKWGWIGTAFGVLAFATPFVKEIADIVDLNTNDSGCQNSQASAAVGSTAAALAIAYIIVKTINNCIVKKRAVMISPIEEQLKELKALEKTFDIMQTFTEEDEDAKETHLMDWTRKMQAHQGIYISEKYKRKWFYQFTQTLPEDNEFRKLILKGDRIARELSSEESSPYSSNDASSGDVEMALSSSGVDSDSDSVHSATSSPFLTDDEADNQAAPPSPKSSGYHLSSKLQRKKLKLERITNQLNERFGYNQFSEGKIAFNSTN